jgi:transcriptional regulator with XRE-family HTH domain
MLTGMEIRAARALLNWSQGKLAKNAGISMSSVQRIESQNGIPDARTRTLLRFERCFQAAGITFSNQQNIITVSLRAPIDEVTQ